MKMQTVQSGERPTTNIQRPAFSNERPPAHWLFEASRLVLACAFLTFATTLSAAEPATTDWTSLFNGRDLTGWTNLNGGKFSATNGVLHLDASSGWLCTTRAFTNFIFEAECRALETNYNSGFFIRASLEGKPFPTNAWQINLKQSTLGALLRGSKPLVTNALPAKPVGEWFTFRITVQGSSATLEADGLRLWKYDDLDVTHGTLGLQAEGKSFEFRKLRVLEDLAAGH